MTHAPTAVLHHAGRLWVPACTCRHSCLTPATPLLFGTREEATAYARELIARTPTKETP